MPQRNMIVYDTKNSTNDGSFVPRRLDIMKDREQKKMAAPSVVRLRVLCVTSPNYATCQSNVPNMALPVAPFGEETKQKWRTVKRWKPRIEELLWQI